MNVLIDTDVLIDLALDRQPFAEHAAILLDAAQRLDVKAYIAWHSVANFYYIVSSPSGKDSAKAFIQELLAFVEIAPVQTDDVLYALALNVSDFEDALQIAAARACRAERILSRNVKHFKNSPIPCETPEAFCQSFI
ncbi:MAG: PIN domain-containing protein [Calditrichaeota bacterium]|nr:PIN domain-containing protein [Calditrichota bacterium]